MTTFEHHLRFSLALALEFEEEGRAESKTVFIADQVINLADWLAAWLTALLTWLNGLRLAIATERRRWAAEWPLIVEAARLLFVGRWVWLEAG